MSAAGVLALSAAWAVAVLAPGYGLTRLLAPSAGRLRAVTVGPAVTLALAGVTITAAAAAGSQIPAATAWALPAVGIGLSAWGEWRAGHGPPSPSRWRRVEIWAAGGGIVALLTAWAAGVQSIRPPNDDSMNHAWFVTRILETSSVDASGVLVSDLILGSPAATYYPLSWHALVAAMAELSGASVAAAMTACFVLTSAVCLPLGMLAITRRLYPGHPTAAVLAPLVAACVATFPYGPISWGGLVLLTVLCLVAGVLELALWSAEASTTRWGAAISVGLAVAGLGYGHPSVLAFAVLLAALLIVVPLDSRGSRSALLAAAARPAAVAVVVLVPMATGLAGGAGERFLAESGSTIGWGTALRSTLTMAYSMAPPWPIWLLVLWVGVAAAAVNRLAVGWLAAFGLMLAAECALLASNAPALEALTSPWYSQAYRFVYQAHLLAIPLAALGLTVAVAGLVRLVPPLAASAPRAAATALAAAVALVPAWAISASAVRGAYQDASVVSADDVAAYRWMAERLGAAERVLGDPAQGTGWMYPEAGAVPVFGEKGLDWTSSRWAGRWRLLEEAHLIGSDPDVTRLADAWDVRFVIAGSGWLVNHERTVDLEELKDAPGLREAYRSGPVVVYERVSAG